MDAGERAGSGRSAASVGNAGSTAAEAPTAWQGCGQRSPPGCEGRPWSQQSWLAIGAAACRMASCVACGTAIEAAERSPRRR
jgi:hypothetical protein